MRSPELILAAAAAYCHNFEIVLGGIPITLQTLDRCSLKCLKFLDGNGASPAVILNQEATHSKLSFA